MYNFLHVKSYQKLSYIQSAVDIILFQVSYSSTTAEDKQGSDSVTDSSLTIHHL